MSLFDFDIGTLADLMLSAPGRTGSVGSVMPILSAGVPALPSPDHGVQVGSARDICLIKVVINLGGK